MNSDYLGRVEGDWSSFALFDKYAIVGEDDEGNKIVQSKYDARNSREPVTITRFEAIIDNIVKDESIRRN